MGRKRCVSNPLHCIECLPGMNTGRWTNTGQNKTSDSGGSVYCTNTSWGSHEDCGRFGRLSHFGGVLVYKKSNVVAINK